LKASFLLLGGELHLQGGETLNFKIDADFFCGVYKKIESSWFFLWVGRESDG
jgi:hypothetical protein